MYAAETVFGTQIPVLLTGGMLLDTQSKSVLLIDGLEITMIRSRRKTLALEITRDCRILVRAPMRFPAAKLRTFLEEHRPWIERTLVKQRTKLQAAPPMPSEAEISVLRERAARELPPKIDYYSRLMGVTPAGIRITSARTRYGSCSAKNRLCFSCFLMTCPDAAIDLVVVHELAHIREKNHGPRFYALLASILPDHQERKKLLTMPRWEQSGPASEQ